MFLRNEVRIIGGKWRRRILPFPSDPSIRPTPDRVRETLFNWLMPVISEARCLDLFAGSGALSFEALSRGAQEVVCIDRAPNVIQSLEKIVNSWKVEGLTLYAQAFPFDPSLLKLGKFTVVFLDPPFNTSLLKTALVWLIEYELLAENAFVYVESGKALAELERWTIHREGKAGQVYYGLLQRTD